MTGRPLITGPFAYMPLRIPGTVVVAISRGGTFCLVGEARLTFVERLMRSYLAFFLVDLSTQTITENWIVPSMRSTMNFVANITINAKSSTLAEPYNEICPIYKRRFLL